MIGIPNHPKGPCFTASQTPRLPTQPHPPATGTSTGHRPWTKEILNSPLWSWLITIGGEMGKWFWPWTVCISTCLPGFRGIEQAQFPHIITSLKSGTWDHMGHLWSKTSWQLVTCYPSVLRHSLIGDNLRSTDTATAALGSKAVWEMYGWVLG